MPDRVPVVLLTTTRPETFYYREIPALADARGYAVSIHRPSEFTGRAGSRVLHNRGVAGIFLGNGCEEHAFGDFQWERFAVVTLDSPSPDVEGHQLRTAVFGPMLELFQRLVDRGFRRIGACLACADPPHPDDHRRRGAFLEGQMMLPKTRRLPVEHFPFRNWSGWPELCDEYIQRHQPDVLIVHNSGHAGQILRRHELPIAALVINESDTHWCSGWKMLDRDKINYAMDVLERNIRTGSTGIHGHKITHQIHPEWNEGTSLATGGRKS